MDKAEGYMELIFIVIRTCAEDFGLKRSRVLECLRYDCHILQSLLRKQFAAWSGGSSKSFLIGRHGGPQSRLVLFLFMLFIWTNRQE